MLELSGLLTQGAGDPLLFEFIGGKPGETYTLMSFAQTDFAEADFGIASGMDGTFALGATSLQFTAQAIADNVIPEPTSAALWGLGGLLMLLIRRRRA